MPRLRFSCFGLWWSVGLVLAVFLATPLLRMTTWMTSLRPPSFFDFGVYYQVGQFALEGLPLYDTPINRISGTGSRYLYPPVVALIFIPFTTLPMETGGLVWNALSLLVLVSGGLSLARVCMPTLTWEQYGLIACLLLIYYPVNTVLVLGQISILLTGLLCFAGAAILRDSESRGSAWIGGGLTAVVALVKTTYAPAGAHLLRRRDRVLAAFATVAIALFIGLLVFGVDEHLAYLDTLRAGKGWGAFSVNDRNRHTYLPLYLFGPARLVIQAGLCLGVAALAVWSSRATSPLADRYVFAMGVLTVPIATPSPNILILTVAIPGTIVVVLTMWQQRNPLIHVALLGLVLVQLQPVGARLLLSSVLWTSFPTSIYWAIYFVMQSAMWGMCLLLGVAVYRVYELTTNTDLRSDTAESQLTQD